MPLLREALRFSTKSKNEMNTANSSTGPMLLLLLAIFSEIACPLTMAFSMHRGLAHSADPRRRTKTASIIADQRQLKIARSRISDDTNGGSIVFFQSSNPNNDNGDDVGNFDAKGFGSYLAPYALALLASVGVTYAFVKFVLLDY